MENKGLLFIPDISGFTKFVNETEIDHSRLIIQELLEILINANQVGLEVSEIEGDAILFYRFGEAPGLEALYKQVEKMFCEFHRSLIAYERRRFCQCKACMSAIDLTLKVITHYGEFTGYTVKQFSKLIGKDIIVAHQLLKNDIPVHEYWLVTDNLFNNDTPADFTQWMQWNSSVKKTDDGDIPFHYTQLTPLKNEIPPEEVPQVDLSKKVKALSFTREYDTDIVTLFHAAGDFNYRHQWMDGVKAVEEVGHFLPRIGMRCRCVMENGQSTIYASSYTYHPDKIQFSETEEKENSTTHYTLDKIDDKRTRLTIDYHMQKNMMKQFLFNLSRKKKMEEMFERSLDNLKGLAKEIWWPGSGNRPPTKEPS